MNILLDFLIKINNQHSNQVIQRFRVCALTIFALGSLSQAALADLTITPTTNSTTIGNQLTGKDVTISNVTINQGTIGNQTGVFSGGITGTAGPLLGIADGVVLVTGTATTADGPNRYSSRTTGGETGPTSTSLSSIESGAQFDTVTLQFNVVPNGNTLSLEYLFASEEYNEFVCTTFNDAMGIFVSGPGITGEVNIARLEQNLASFSINEINRGVAGAAASTFPAPCNLNNSQFYINNISNYNETIGTTNAATPAAVQSSFTNVEYDGFTKPLAATVKVQPNQTYTIKIVTADIGDSAWDGGVFIDRMNSYDLDYGDAPNSYGTSSIDQAIQLPGPARHSIDPIPFVYLGSVAPDAEGNGTPATSPNPANSDDNTASDDEDAFSSTLTASSGITSHTISNIPVHNTSTQTAKLMGWIDFNKDGDFLDAGEQATVNVSPNQTTANLTWSGFSSTSVGNTYARFRITTDSNLINSPSSIGLAINGEVEDYQVAIAGYDYGDAPSSYGDASHDNPATPTVYLGSIKPDKELSTQLGTDSGAAAAGDDNNGTPDDEDAFTALANVPIVGNYSLNVPVHNTSSNPATLHAWIDFDKDGQFESGEYQNATVANNSTTASLNWTVPIGTLPGSTHVRFRLTSDNTLIDNIGTSNIDERSIGNASNGEVEDYPVSISVPIYDYGDAPDTGTGTGAGNYQTTASDGGAAQVKINTAGLVLSLGSNIDTDDGTLQNAAANADDINGTPNDEDGVASFPALTTTANQTYTIPVTVQNNVPLVNAYLVGYIDFNKDGDFLDAGEKSATITVPTGSTNPRTFNVTFTTPAGMTTGNTYARFRLGQVQATAESATGASISTDNGEIEDYQIAIAPAVASNPKLLLVKRITAINPGQPDAIQFNNFVDDTATTDDNNANWPDSDGDPNINTHLRGTTNVAQIKPGDEVEYTIYFLSSGDAEAKNVKLCDVVPDNMTFVSNSYSTGTGIALALNGTILPTAPNINLSNAIDTDQGDFYLPGTNPPVTNLCKKTNPNNPNSLISVDDSNNLSGAVLIKLTTPIPPATGSGTPTNSYGFIRFRAKVK